MSMALFYIYRMITLGLSFIFSLALLGLLAHWASSNPFGTTSFPFDSFGLFLASVMMIKMPIMLILPEIRKNAYILYIVYELIIVCILWILWVIAAALAIQQQGVTFPIDDCTVYFANLVSWCDELSAIVGLSVTVFVLLLIYTLSLAVYAIFMASRTGSRVWFQSAKDIQIRMPAMTHSTGDLVSKSDLSIPLNSFPAVGSAPALSPPQTYSHSHSQQPPNIQQRQNIPHAPSPLASVVTMQVVPAKPIGRPTPGDNL